MTYNPNLYKDQSKRDRTPYWGQVQRWIFKAKTKEQWVETFNGLSPKEQYDLLARFVPVPKEVKVDQQSTFQLIINGLPKKAIDVKAVDTKILEEHLDEEESVDR